MFGLNNTGVFYAIILVLLVNMVFSTNHVNSLILFFISTLVYYVYCYSINCNWISLIILLWYARRISVLFYLLACYSSSLTYSSVYNYSFNKVKIKTLQNKPLMTYAWIASVIKILLKFWLLLSTTIYSKSLVTYVESKNFLTQRQYSNVFNSYSSNKPIILKWTKFSDIYSSITGTPSSIFLIAFLLPVFAYLIYFVCNYLSYRK